MTTVKDAPRVGWTDDGVVIEGGGGRRGGGGGVQRVEEREGELEEPGVAAATEVISGPMGSHSTQRERPAQVPGIKIIITLH